MTVDAGRKVTRGHSFRAMASRVEFSLVEPSIGADDALVAAEQVFRDVESSCTRFDPASPLMQANAAGRAWHEVPRECFDAVSEAAAAHELTEGRFDPRVLRVLTGLGYDRTLPFASGGVHTDTAPQQAALRAPGRGRFGRRRAWRPGLAAARSAVRIGPDPIDLGGIGKGLAVRWAAAPLRRVCRAALVSAGGDVYAHGRGPDGDGWRIAVEDPFGGPDPAAVLSVHDVGVATSSTRIRSWQAGQRRVHHLIDPRTGEPAAGDLAAVTVVHRDPAIAEVWSKSLFIAGQTEIRGLAEHRDLAALWVTTDGRVGLSRAMLPHAIWKVHRVR